MAKVPMIINTLTRIRNFEKKIVRILVSLPATLYGAVAPPCGPHGKHDSHDEIHDTTHAREESHGSHDGAHVVEGRTGLRCNVSKYALGSIRGFVAELATHLRRDLTSEFKPHKKKQAASPTLRFKESETQFGDLVRFWETSRGQRTDGEADPPLKKPDISTLLR